MNFGLLKASVDVGNERLEDAVSHALGHSISGGHTTATHDIAEQLKSGSLKSDSLENNTTKQAALIQKLQSMSLDVNRLLNQSKVIYSDVGSGSVDQYTDQEIKDLQAKISSLQRDSLNYIDLTIIDNQIKSKKSSEAQIRYFNDLKTGVQNFNDAMRQATNMVSSITNSYNAAKQTNTNLQSELTKAKAEYAQVQSDGKKCLDALKKARSGFSQNPNPQTRTVLVNSSEDLSKKEAQLAALREQVNLLEASNREMMTKKNAKDMKKVREKFQKQIETAAAKTEYTRLDSLMKNTSKQWWKGIDENRPVPIDFEIWWRSKNPQFKGRKDSLRLFNISKSWNVFSYMTLNRYDLLEPRTDIDLIEVDETLHDKGAVGDPPPSRFFGAGSTSRGEPARFGSTAREEPARFGSTAREEPARFGSTAREKPARFGSTAREEPARFGFGSTAREPARFGSTARQTPSPIDTQDGDIEPDKPATPVARRVLRKASHAAMAAGKFAGGAAGGVSTTASAAARAAGGAARAAGGAARAAGGAARAAGVAFGLGTEDNDHGSNKNMFEELYEEEDDVMDEGEEEGQDVMDEVEEELNPSDLNQGRQGRRPAVTGLDATISHDGLKEELREEIIKDTIDRLGGVQDGGPSETKINWNYGKLFSTGTRKIGGKSGTLSNLSDVMLFIKNAFSTSTEREIIITNGRTVLRFPRLEQGVVNSVYKTFERVIADAPPEHPTNGTVFIKPNVEESQDPVDYRKTFNALMYIVYRQGLYDMDGSQHIMMLKRLTGAYEMSPFSSMFLWM